MVVGHWNILQDGIRHKIKVRFAKSFLDQAQGSREPAPQFQPRSPLIHHLWGRNNYINGRVFPGNRLFVCATRANEEGKKEAEDEVKCTSNYAQEVMGLRYSMIKLGDSAIALRQCCVKDC